MPAWWHSGTLRPMSTLSPDDPLPDDPVALQALVRGQRERIAEWEQRLAWFLVQYRLAQHRRFAPSTETTVHQLDLFAELLAEALPDAAPPTPVASSIAGDPDAGLPAAAHPLSGPRRSVRLRRPPGGPPNGCAIGVRYPPPRPPGAQSGCY